VDDAGNPITQPRVIPTLELISCRSCKLTFHGCGCTGLPKNKPAWSTVSLVKSFNSETTKPNFLFLCDECLTSFEQREADVESERITRLEKRLINVEGKILSELSELKSLSSKAPVPSPPPVVPTPPNPLWTDPARLDKLKVPATFMVRPDSGGNAPVSLSKIGELADKQSIPVHSTSSDPQGRTWITTQDQESCDKLKLQLSQGESPVDKSSIVDVYNKTPTVVLVGLQEELDKEVIFDTIRRVNSFGSLMNSTSFRILSVKQTKKSKQGSVPVFQCVVAVSDIIRKSIEDNKNRVYFRGNALRAYDQFYIKRCNTCQSFHHYSHKCTSATPVCANCAGNHCTADCTVDTSDTSNLRCANCGKLGNGGDVRHRASDPNCPSFLHEQVKLKNSINYYNQKN